MCRFKLGVRTASSFSVWNIFSTIHGDGTVMSTENVFCAASHNVDPCAFKENDASFTLLGAWHHNVSSLITELSSSDDLIKRVSTVGHISLLQSFRIVSLQVISSPRREMFRLCKCSRFCQTFIQ